MSAQYAELHSILMFARDTALQLPLRENPGTCVLKYVLLVDPDAEALVGLQNALRSIADVESCTDFQTARARLLEKRPDLLVTNLRLEAYNGLHLVYLAATVGLDTRTIVYADRCDLFLAREAKSAGAFYESQQQLPYAVASYVGHVLPARDRRHPGMPDRRQSFRGGRRSADLRAVRAQG